MLLLGSLITPILFLGLTAVLTNFDEHEGENITGTDEADDITSGNGNDLIRAGAGHDVVQALAGDDEVYGEQGNDTLIGGSGDDYLRGSAGHDQLFGQDGEDTLIGGAAKDVLYGADIFDSAGLQNGVENLALFTSEAQPYYQPENDPGHADTLIGGSGDDIFLPGDADVVTLGTGEDRVHLSDANVGEQAATISDYDPIEDQIVYYYDTDEAPSVSFAQDSDGTAILQRMEVSGNNSTLVRLDGVDSTSLSDSDIVLIRAFAVSQDA